MFDGYTVDNFYLDPIAVRSELLSQPFAPPHPSGRGGPAWRCTLPPNSELERKLSDVWGFPIYSLHSEARYNLGSSSTPRGFCHSDFSVSEFTAVIYMSLPEHCQGGTNFFRHRPSKSIYYHPGLGQLNYADPDSWELIHTVDMVFNRLTTYPSKNFHGIKRPFFGVEKENARLIQSIRFNRAT